MLEGKHVPDIGATERINALVVITHCKDRCPIAGQQLQPTVLNIVRILKFIYQNVLKTLAHNKVGAQLGQKVIIETSSSVIFGAAMLVYVMPLMFFITGYIAAYLLGASEGICVLISFIALIISAVILVMSQRSKKKKDIKFDIIEICEG